MSLACMQTAGARGESVTVSYPHPTQPYFLQVWSSAFWILVGYLCPILSCSVSCAQQQADALVFPSLFTAFPPHPKCSLSILKRGIEKIRPFKTSNDQRKGRYLYDVHRFFEFFYLLPPPFLHSAFCIQQIIYPVSPHNLLYIICISTTPLTPLSVRL